MSYLQSIFLPIQGMQITDILDIIVVAFLIYKLVPIFRTSGTAKIAWTVVVVLIFTWLTDMLDMYAMNFVLNMILEVGLIAIVVLYQPE